jgi:phosphoglycerate dehydrogenase-like enzyme
MRILGPRYRFITSALRFEFGTRHEVLDYDPGRELTAQLEDVDVLIAGGHLIDARTIDAAPRLKLIHQNGRGIDRIDVDHARRRGVAVRWASGSGQPMAEHALTLVLMMLRGIHQTAPSIRNRVLGEPNGRALAGATLGVVGLGESGTTIVRLARAIGLKVIAVCRDPERHDDPAIWPMGELPRLLREADVVSLHVLGSSETRDLIGKDELAAMRPSASLVNCARGLIVSYAALYDALRARRISGAAFDCFWTEPAPPGDPILALDNFVLTPHIAAFTREYIADVVRSIAGNVDLLARGELVP